MTMTSELLWAFTATATIVILSAIIMRRLCSSKSQEATKKPDSLPQPTILSISLASALPNSVILPQHDATFNKSKDSYWAKQETEVIPGCIVRPQNVQELCQTVTLLNNEYERQEKQSQQDSGGLFAIRGGGHSAVHGAASISGGVIIDLSLFCEIIPSKDGSSVIIGAGARWRDVSKILDEKGLAVVGGRNSDVGVGGLTLGGGLSWFSSRFGLVCSNIISYEIVLASGTVVNASAKSNSDLWRALKGGANNFGVVTSFTARSFPATKIWSGFLYMPSFQAQKVLTAFHEFVGSNSGITYDDSAAGPLACFTYIGDLGLQAISVNLVYTKLPESERKWPACWKLSPFASLWRLWSTCKVRSLTDATEELSGLNPPGRRQDLAATTVKNDTATLAAAHAAYRDAISLICRVKGISWTLVLQPMLPEWARKGDPNPLGLDEGSDDPLVIVSFTVNWLESKDDEFVKATVRQVIERIEAFAVAHKTGHRYRYLNYCAHWQRPFEGYGVENWRFLREVSKKYDPDGLFQKGCVGGFKLDVVDD
ncbi:hypothetical protein MMC18_000785 [Xylographa bjoerkii]|nr:hypothetical protein [Xylographa bjoerkii]